MNGLRMPDAATAIPEGSDPVAEFRRVIRSSGSAWLVVSGGCMAPTLMEHQPVRVRRAAGHRVGEVAVLEASGSLLIHRLVDRVQAGPRSWYVHMGDASWVPGLASAEELIGVAEGLGPRLRPAPRAHLWGILLRVGALLMYLGLPASGAPAISGLLRPLTGRS